MTRIKRVRFVGVEHHERMKAQLGTSLAKAQIEIALMQLTLETLEKQVTELTRGIRSMLQSARRIRLFRNRLRANLHMVMGACSGAGCKNVMFRAHDDIGGRFRLCATCMQRNVASFVNARDEIFRASPMSPTAQSLLCDDSSSEASI